MSLADDLLSQAGRLTNLEPRRPKQASLRRAVSTAYYAVFHLLTDDAARRLVHGADRDFHRTLVSRAFAHTRMAEASGAFQGGTLPRSLATSGVAISAEVSIVADAFVLLQQERHEADYNTSGTFTRHRAEAAVRLAQTAFVAWRTARGATDADLYLLAMLLPLNRP